MANPRKILEVVWCSAFSSSFALSTNHLPTTGASKQDLELAKTRALGIAKYAVEALGGMVENGEVFMPGDVYGEGNVIQ